VAADGVAADGVAADGVAAAGVAAGGVAADGGWLGAALGGAAVVDALPHPAPNAARRTATQRPASTRAGGWKLDDCDVISRTSLE
jgi:hypothetical protein